MTEPGEKMPFAGRLPYPHARNDCAACRKRDADVLLLDGYDELVRTGKRPVVLCQGCLGKHVTLRAVYESGDTLDEPVTVRVTVAPGRRGGEST